MTRAEELTIATKYLLKFAWPTVLLAFALTLLYGGIYWAALVGQIPMWLGMLLNGVVAFWFYTIHHEANHENICGKHKKWLWLNKALGMLSAIPLMLSFEHFSRSHMQHHIHTNIPGKDPDANLAGPASALLPRWVLVHLIKLLVYVPGMTELVGRLLPQSKVAIGMQMFKTNRAGERFYLQVCFVLIVIGTVLGYGVPLVMLWWIPSALAMLILHVWFAWIPHSPYKETVRYRNTRVRTWPGSHWLLMAQDYHLTHHLYPRIPFYHYRAFCKEIRASLDQNGAVLDGKDAQLLT